MIDDDSYGMPNRPYLPGNDAEIAAPGERWGGWDASDSQIIGSGHSRYRGCRIVVILHDDLE
ncbi:hypothetical protein [Rhizobium binxianense]|uniref:hypothetical protein n=1 Tax=Rhizobium binxianense TaxID=3024242 RepID=UPI00235DD90B|nr:hypothetical protein [Rhizobium sp. MJ37]MDC9835865.1 hypothetical protein [Rhizobium sp. MJ37]